jgi:hypothetical protein
VRSWILTDPTHPTSIISTKLPLGFQHIYKPIFLPSSLALSHSSLFFSAQPPLPCHARCRQPLTQPFTPQLLSPSQYLSFSLSLLPSQTLQHLLYCFNKSSSFIHFFFVLFLSNTQISQTHAHTKFLDFDKANLGVSSFLGSLTLKWQYKLQNIKNENKKSRNLHRLCCFSSSPLLLLLFLFCLLASASSFLVLCAIFYLFSFSLIFLLFSFSF